MCVCVCVRARARGSLLENDAEQKAFQCFSFWSYSLSSICHHHHHHHLLQQQQQQKQQQWVLCTLAKPVPKNVVVPHGDDVTAREADGSPESGQEEVDVRTWRRACATGSGVAGSEKVGLSRDRHRVPGVPQQPLRRVLAAVKLCSINTQSLL